MESVTPGSLAVTDLLQLRPRLCCTGCPESHTPAESTMSIPTSIEADSLEQPIPLELAQELAELRHGRAWQLPPRSSAAEGPAGARVVLIHHQRDQESRLPPEHNWLRLD